MKKLAISVAIIVIGLLIAENLNPSYKGSWFHEKYPCVIMEGPGLKFILQQPGGEITVEYTNKEVQQ